MPPTPRLLALAEKATLVSVRKADPSCETYRKEFDARASSWIVVLDAKGELLDCRAADPTGLLKNKDSFGKFAGQFADRVEQALARKETLQDLERRWAGDMADAAAFEALAARHEEQGQNTRLRELCDKLAALPGLAADRRADALLRGFGSRSKEYGVLGTPEADAKFVEDGERLLAGHAAEPRAAAAAEALFQSGYAGKFDVPGRCAAGIARLEALAKGLPDPVPLRQRIAELSKLLEKEVAKLEVGRVAAKGREASEAWYAGALGDAETVVRVFGQPAFENQPFFQRWVQEAREKLKAGGK